MGGIVVLLNRAARGGRAAALEAPLAAALASLAPGARLLTPASAAAAAAAVDALPPSSRVVVTGGDGTLQPLLGALIARRHELALVPFGSGDDAARALGLRGLPWQQALTLALGGTASAVDTGRVRTPDGDHPFLSSLCAGFDAAVGERALAGPAWLAGLPRYLLATLQELATLKTARLRVQADGQLVHDGPALFASTLNTPTYGGGMPAAPAAQLDDGRLDLVVAGEFGRAGALAMLPLLLAGAHLRHPRVRTLRFEHLRVDADAPLPLAADGEPLPAAAGFDVHCARASLRVVRGPGAGR
jgi:diacylglycerol kinase family enzyme